MLKRYFQLLLIRKQRWLKWICLLSGALQVRKLFLYFGFGSGIKQVGVIVPPSYVTWSFCDSWSEVANSNCSCEQSESCIDEVDRGAWMSGISLPWEVSQESVPVPQHAYDYLPPV